MIQHVTREIRPGELDECTVFYGLLGFQPVPAPPGIAGRAAWLEHSGTQIHLMFVTDAAAAERRPSGHVGVVVERYAETVAALSAAGREVEPRSEHWGSPRAYVRDPAGYLVEVMAWAPGETGPPSETEAPPTGKRHRLRARQHNRHVDLARFAWLAAVLVLLVAVLVLVLQGYYGYAGVTFAVAVSAAVNLI